MPPLIHWEYLSNLSIFLHFHGHCTARGHQPIPYSISLTSILTVLSHHRPHCTLKPRRRSSLHFWSCLSPVTVCASPPKFTTLGWWKAFKNWSLLASAGSSLILAFLQSCRSLWTTCGVLYLNLCPLFPVLPLPLPSSIQTPNLANSYIVLQGSIEMPLALGQWFPNQ